MSKKNKIIISLLVVTLIVLCGYFWLKPNTTSEIQNVVNENLNTNSIVNAGNISLNQSFVKADEFYIEEIVRNYETLLVEAINTNDFSLIENLLIPGSNLYNAQKKLVSDLYKKNIKEKLIDVDIVEITAGEKEDIYRVFVTETIAIKYPGNDFVERKFNWIYTVIYEGDKLGLSDIEKWNID